jgi:DNA-binding transcriptional ArsR family regulator
MNKRYLHISYDPPVDSWLPRVMTRLRGSSSIALQSRMESWGETPLREMGLAFSTKLVMLSQVAERLDKQLRRLSQHLTEETDKVQQCIRRGAAYMVPERLLPYAILVDIDSFLFESRSIYEIVGKFLTEFHLRILAQRVTENHIKDMMVTRGIDDRWIRELQESRKLFFHQTAPWIALEIKSLGPTRFELLVLKRDLRDFSNPDDYISFDQLRDIFNGFRASMSAIHEWLLEKINDFEMSEKT